MADITPAAHWSSVASAWADNADHVETATNAATAALVEAVGVSPGDDVLELAAGPGALGGRWSELVGASGRVVLSDIAPGMVDIARESTAHLENVELAVVDAAAIDRPDASFDVVVCRMGLMFAPDPALALGEMRRVLRPGGRVGALTWAGPEHNPWMTCVGMAAAMNGLVAGPAPVGPGGIFSLADPDRLAELVEDAAFCDVLVEVHTSVFHAESIDAHVDRVSSLAGPLAAAFASATPDELAAVRSSAAQLAAEHIGDDGVTFPGRALLVTGRV